MGRELRGPVQARLLFTGNIGKHIESGYNFIRSTVPRSPERSLGIIDHDHHTSDRPNY